MITQILYHSIIPFTHFSASLLSRVTFYNDIIRNYIVTLENIILSICINMKGEIVMIILVVQSRL